MITTSRTILAAVVALAVTSRPPALRAQSADVDAVKRVIAAETETYYRKDAEGWKATWVNDSTAIRTFITSASFSVALGWDKFGPGTVESIRKEPTPVAVQIDRTNYVVRIDGALAWAEYDERTSYPSGAPPLLARQQRTLVKQNGAWKILSAGSFVGSSYGTDKRAVEDRLNQLGDDLSAARNHRDALEVLELSARLSPGSPRVHLALGAAHAAAGNARLAIQSYEKALAIDPSNEQAKAALAKVRSAKAP
jgi:tetratricopeptide (TPR) repeat protein